MTNFLNVYSPAVPQSSMIDLEYHTYRLCVGVKFGEKIFAK
jgi:hypothetical protein